MDITKLSPEQTAIVMATITEGEFRASSVNERSKISKLHGYGLVRRHETDPTLCFATDAGRQAAAALGLFIDSDSVISPTATAILEHDGARPADAPRGGVPEIVTMMLTALALFGEGDIARARVIADGAYDLSQAEARFAAKYAATRELVPKFRQLQGDALMLETKCKIMLAKAYDAAQAAGEAAKKGRPKNVAADDIFKQAEAGLTRQEIHDARKLAAAEEKTPGIAERAIAARIAQGLAPTRASLKHAIGTKTATKEERGNNLYETPPEGTWTILSLEQFADVVEEPFCGRGAIVRVLEAVGYDVVISDLVDYGTVTKDGECQGVADYMTTEGPSHDIVSNPPYGDEMNAVIAHALRVRRPRKMALLLNLNVLSGYEDADRTFYMETCPPARIYVNKHRLPMMHRDGWDGNKASSQMNTMWCVWEMDEDGTYGSQTVLYRVDYEADEVARFRAAHEAESEAA
ncbi:SAM-dependent methyltransferase [Pararhizobium sp. O133]|uniref:SAM-dependent methyltransferase n=1 Tax=Pararhizobium sp. O133 TaxID=3449278 RepID=UPI003F6876E2